MQDIILDSLEQLDFEKQKEASIKLILNAIGDSEIVMLGESTHGTKEYYDIRAEITKALIKDKNFNCIAIEGDWPDAYQINKYINGEEYNNGEEPLKAFDRFPTWMWRNQSVLTFISWLHKHNKNQDLKNKANFYGLDLYSLYRSIDTVINILDSIDPKAAEEARSHYSCFDQFGGDIELYGQAVLYKIIDSCSEQVVEQLQLLLIQDRELIKENKLSLDQAFDLEQNARVIKNGEDYYRSLFISGKNTWNLRDSHMFEMLNFIIESYKKKNINTPKIIIWAHNTHVGDASATEFTQRGEFNIGQLIREKFGAKSVSIGFMTYTGTVSAASNWHSPVERKFVRNSLMGSFEFLFHEIKINQFLLGLKNKKLILPVLLERAIGVVYKPETERSSHYFYANLQKQFDFIIYIDKTTALEPLDKNRIWIAGEFPETYPFGL